MSYQVTEDRKVTKEAYELHRDVRQKMKELTLTHMLSGCSVGSMYEPL